MLTIYGFLESIDVKTAEYDVVQAFWKEEGGSRGLCAGTSYWSRYGGSGASIIPLSRGLG